VSRRRVPEIGESVTFHGLTWTVTGRRPIHEDDGLLPEMACHELGLATGDGIGTVCVWVDACAVQMALLEGRAG